MYWDATSLCQDHLFINQTIMNIGCISVNFHDVAGPLRNMKDFIFLQILSESVDWIKYLAKIPRRESGLTAYLAIGISKQRYITLQHSFLKDVTRFQLLNHYCTKKPFYVSQYSIVWRFHPKKLVFRRTKTHWQFPN